MRKIIQVIGLQGSGKSTWIKEYINIKKYIPSISHIDIADYSVWRHMINEGDLEPSREIEETEQTSGKGDVVYHTTTKTVIKRVKPDKIRNPDKVFRKLIEDTPGIVFAESVCGIRLRTSKIIKLEIPPDTREKQLIARDGKIDHEYDRLLEQEMIPSNYIVKTKEAFFSILDKLLDG